MGPSGLGGRHHRLYNSGGDWGHGPSCKRREYTHHTKLVGIGSVVHPVIAMSMHNGCCIRPGIALSMLDVPHTIQVGIETSAYHPGIAVSMHIILYWWGWVWPATTVPRRFLIRLNDVVRTADRDCSGTTHHNVFSTQPDHLV
jgi:hypothetical protein